MFDVLAKARSSPLLAQQLDWPKRVSMALDAAKVGVLHLHCICCAAAAVAGLSLLHALRHDTCPACVY